MRKLPAALLCRCLAMAMAAATLAACAPPPPLIQAERPIEVTASEPSEPVVRRGADTRGARRADAEVLALKSALREPEFSTEVVLALLIDFPLGELAWQRQQHARDATLRPWLDLAVTARSALLDDARLAEDLRRWAARHPQAAALGPDPLPWLRSWRSLAGTPAGVVVWLPTEASPLAQAGAALREGVMAAWLALPSQQRPALTFLYADGDSEAEISAMHQRIARLDAAVLLGPLARPQVEALMRRPSAAAHSLLLNEPLSSEALAARANPTLTRFALLPEEEARQAAELALTQGYRRALVLGQDSDWGRRLVSAFNEAMVAGGGMVMEQGFYASNQVDHSELLEALLGLNQSATREARLRRLLGEDLRSEPQRRSDIDVIFLASRADEARLIRPQLRFFRAEALPVVATSYSLDGVPNPHLDEDLRGLLMPLSDWFMPDRPAARLRAQAQLDNPTLSRLYAMGHDSLHLALWLDRMVEDPELQWPGLTGRLQVSDQGRVQRDLEAVALGRGRLAQTP